MSRGRAEQPVRDYRVEAGDDRVTVTFDAPDSPEPQAYPDPDSNDLLISFGGAPPRRVVAWGGLAVPDAPRPAASAPHRTAPTRRAAQRPTSTGAPVARPGAWPSAPAQATPAVVPPYAPGAAPGQSSSTYAGSGANWRLDTIVLDAGHGGHDIGATYNGVREKDVTLGIVRHLGRMIESELGVRVVYTRTDDHFETLRDRGRIANRVGGKLFVSVHANAAGASSARGTETYFLAPHRSASAQEVMDRENSVIQMETAPDLYAEFNDEGNILQAMAMSAYQEESQELARLIEGQFVGQRRPSRGVKQAGFLVLWAASMPAVLVETGFVSNADEARLLGSQAGQEQTARAIFRALEAYKARYERGLRLASAG
jgi:N-acetylmuramoyl-L-alanine amidase